MNHTVGYSRVRLELAFGRLVSQEKETCTWRGREKCTTNSAIDTVPATIFEKPTLSLQTSLERVNGEKEKISRGTRQTATLRLVHVRKRRPRSCGEIGYVQSERRLPDCCPWLLLLLVSMLAIAQK